MKRVNELLGLSADASEDAAIAEVTKLKNRAKELGDEHAALKNRATELETANAALLKDQVETDLEKYKNRIDPEKTETVRKQLLANRAGTLELLDALPAQKIDSKAAAGTPLHNRRDAATPNSPVKADADQAGDQKNAAAIKNRANEIQFQNPKWTWGTCFNNARAELAD